MKIANLGRTGLKVSTLCLGTMQFGWTADREASFAVLDAFREAGGNFLDTADVYSRWAEGNSGGMSEEIIGAWLKERGAHREMVIATKVRGRMWAGPGGDGLSRRHILLAVEDSLRRLGVEAIDLYQSHSVDPETPIEETLSAFDSLVSSGKVRYLGCSNYPAWRLARALWASDKSGWARYDSLQPRYSLVHREEFEKELMPLCAEQGIGVIPYSPLAGGFLTGKYRANQPLPDSKRAEGIRDRAMTEANFARLARIELVGQGRGATPAQISLAWLLANPVITAPIIGANSVAQLAELLPATELALTPEEKALLEEDLAA